MFEDSRPPDTDKHSSVSIGDILSGIRSSIAERDVIFGPTEQQQAMRNRRALLEMVKNTWIKGVLEQSLHSVVMTELEMEERTDAVERPWDMVLRIPGQEDREIPPGTQIIDVFNEMNGSLLILGEPGSGKTTMLLDLARDAIARAEEDPTQPIPVFFNLSFRAGVLRSIDKWLVEELNTKYQIPKCLARPWVENDDLLLLLDGLDEVSKDSKDGCIAAINRFLQEHMTPVVICSRVVDYESLINKLELRGAVILQPFTFDQIDRYFADRGTELLAVRKTIRYDLTLREFAQTPLMLSVMTFAYRGVSATRSPKEQEMLAKSLGLSNSVEAQRRRILDTYVDQALDRRGVDQTYPAESVVHWLSWLAHRMTKHGQRLFLIKQIQPSWLQPSSRIQLYLVGLGLLIVGALIIAKVTRGGLFSIGASFLVGYLGLLAHGNSGPITRPYEALIWSWKGAMKGLLTTLAAALILELAASFVYDVSIQGLVIAWRECILAGVMIGLCVGPILIPLTGLKGVESEARVIPNQGVRRSARTTLMIFLLMTMTPALSLILVDILGGGLDAWRLTDFLAIFTLGGAVGLVFGLIFGGITLLKHFAIRAVICSNGNLPWRLVRFLDYATDLTFLRKVGGGYIFVHRLLQDYFASLYEEQHK